MLSKDAKDLALLLTFFGEDGVPTTILDRATEPRRFFNQKGEIDLAPAPDLGLVNDKLNSALNELQSSNIIIEAKATEGYAVRANWRQHLTLKKTLKIKVAKLVFHTFPTDPDAEQDL